jgi:quinoprotein glucose dehydrogenase
VNLAAHFRNREKPMQRSRHSRAALAATLTLGTLLGSGLALGDDELYKPQVAGSSPEASEAARSIRLAPGLKVELFAAEPLLANPVAFCIDEKGKVFVAETFRLHAGVTDNRSHMNWLDADMALKTVADRVAMYRKYLSPKEFRDYQVEHERVRMIVDTDGDGKADHATVFADGFKDAADGIGAGLLARRGDVFYTCIPDLWRLRDKDGDGKAEVKESLSTGYGVHVAFLGHDLHGLKMGPDGRIYFSVGDRGLNVTTREGKHLYAPDCGSVLRCEPDGSNLEIYATGLRNPQELAFDNYGNLFTCDNNSDGGDKARWVHVVEGGDSGWRMGYQYLDFPTSRGPWNAEKLWHPRWEGQAAYIIPPITNISDGPSGLVHDPGTGLPAKYRDHFFLADFRGGAGNSGIRSFANKPKGAGFELVDAEQPIWSVLATDVDFGPDGAMYISDWVNGWNKPGKGRIWKVTSAETDPNVAEVKSLLNNGMTKRSVDDLARLLGHVDQRVRLEAQFELADRLREEQAKISKDLTSPRANRSNWAKILVDLAEDENKPRLVRLHALWCLAQSDRERPGKGLPLYDQVLFGLSADKDVEVRGLAAKLLGDTGRGLRTSNAHLGAAEFRGGINPRSISLRLQEETEPQVQFQLAIMIGKIGCKPAFDALIGLLKKNDDKDAYVRHAAVMGLVGINDIPSLVKAAADSSPAVRIGALLALRRLVRPEASKFLSDSDPKVAREAGLAIYEAPIPDAMPALADIATKKGLTEALQRRAINAANRVGRAEDAQALATVATRPEAPRNVRIESLAILAAWANPPGRDRINGLWRPIDVRPAKVAADALRPAVKGLLEESPDEIRRETIAAVAELKIVEAGPDLLALIVAGKGSGVARADSLKALEKLNDPKLADAVEAAVGSKEGSVRSEGLRVLAKLSPERAIPALAKVLEVGSTTEKQKALEVLGSSDRPEADAIVASWLERLIEKKAPTSIQLELIEAASKKKATRVTDLLAKFEKERPKDGPIAEHLAELEGGNAERGKKIFRDNAAVYCVRCHKVKGEGGEVGPELTGIGTKHPRTYLLESIVAPNQAIAQGFESVVLAKTDGTVVTGVLKSEDDKTVKVMTAEAKLIEVPKADIEERKRGNSAMPEDLPKKLTRAEVRDLVEFLAGLK